MSCPYHQNLCAYPDWDPEICEICHATWAKITAPATRIETRPGRDKDGKSITVEEVHYLSGYGELPLDHFWRHATDIKRAEIGARRRSATRKAVA